MLDPSGPVPAAEHRVSVDERGSFAFASCSCGWFAPARRSRDRARRDAAEHLSEHLSEYLGDHPGDHPADHPAGQRS
ncbi:hypothetical protein [Kitasatospora sp. MBT63]|uniref:hypothetical protein n=1 Tax=Kitasatospora sp. MBT63 TaxID=1444768 RepID=UPI001E34B3EC|nr:hypothetical protein [Kitasatospora sp. MBT63]